MSDKLNDFLVYQDNDNLRLWIHCAILTRGVKLPYLYIYGPPRSGKTYFVSILKEHCRIATYSGSCWNPEMSKAEIMVLDEQVIHNTDRLVNFVESEDIIIQEPTKDERVIQNRLNWIHLSQNFQPFDGIPRLQKRGILVIQFKEYIA